MFTVKLLLSLYFTSLFSFLFFTHPVICCLLLTGGAAICCGLVYRIVGFSWYIILFGLVYIGGVYVLFIFVSVCRPNLGIVSKGNPYYFFLGFMLFFCLRGGICRESVSFGDHRDFLCSGQEGYLFCMLCVLLLLGLLFVSLVSNVKDSFYR